MKRNSERIARSLTSTSSVESLRGASITSLPENTSGPDIDIDIPLTENGVFFASTGVGGLFFYDRQVSAVRSAARRISSPAGVTHQERRPWRLGTKEKRLLARRKVRDSSMHGRIDTYGQKTL